jgi:hypothetical protein
MFACRGLEDETLIDLRYRTGVIDLLASMNQPIAQPAPSAAEHPGRKSRKWNWHWTNGIFERPRDP